MKPRLVPAPLTPEDLAIMALCVACNPGRTNEYCICSRYYNADRRDADLMLEAQQQLTVCFLWWPKIPARVYVRGGESLGDFLATVIGPRERGE